MLHLLLVGSNYNEGIDYAEKALALLKGKENPEFKLDLLFLFPKFMHLVENLNKDMQNYKKHPISLKRKDLSLHILVHAKLLKGVY